MALTPHEVKKIAALARLRLTPEEEARVAGQLSRIVDSFGVLERFGSADTEFRGGGSQEGEDRVRPGLPRELFLANAPRKLGAFLVVPTVHPVSLPQNRGSGEGDA